MKTVFLIFVMKVPIGARFIGIPGTETAENPRGLMVEVQWEQDDSGALCISHQSHEMPIPPHVQVQLTTSTAAAPPNTNFLSRQKQIHGIVIDPTQTIDTNL